MPLGGPHLAPWRLASPILPQTRTLGTANRTKPSTAAAGVRTFTYNANGFMTGQDVDEDLGSGLVNRWTHTYTPYAEDRLAG